MNYVEIEEFCNSVPEQARQHARNAVRIEHARRQGKAVLAMIDTYRDQLAGNVEVGRHTELGRLKVEVFEGNEDFIVANDLDLRVLAPAEMICQYSTQLDRLDQAMASFRSKGTS
jgi:hypothetical protein